MLPACVLLALTACTHSRPVALPTDLDWVPFYWLTASIGATQFEHSAIVIELDSLHWQHGGMLQLDLAASGTMPRGYPALGADGETRRSGPVSGFLAEVPDLRLRRGSVVMEVGSRQIGTMGLPLFERQTLLIDFTQLRFAALPTRRDDPITLVGPRPVGVLDFDGNRLFLLIETPSGSGTRGLLDTGLVPFEVWTTRYNWERWTGKSVGDVGVHRYVIPTSRNTMVFAAAEAQRDFVAAGRRFARREVVFLESGPPGAALEEWPFPVEAVLGVSFFASAGLLVLDPQNRRFSLPLQPTGR